MDMRWWPTLAPSMRASRRKGKGKSGRKGKRNKKGEAQQHRARETVGLEWEGVTKNVRWWPALAS